MDHSFKMERIKFAVGERAITKKERCLYCMAPLLVGESRYCEGTCEKLHIEERSTDGSSRMEYKG